MKRLAILSVLALAACAGQPEAPIAAAPVAPAPAPEPPPVLAAPQEPVAAAPIAAPSVVGMRAHDIPATRPAQDPRTLVYLASYKTETSARDGFRHLAKASPILARQQPVTQKVDLGKKGTWVRLYGMAADEAERGRICAQVARRVDECGARNRE